MPFDTEVNSRPFLLEDHFDIHGFNAAMRTFGTAGELEMQRRQALAKGAA